MRLILAFVTLLLWTTQGYAKEWAPSSLYTTSSGGYDAPRSPRIEATEAFRGYPVVRHTPQTRSPRVSPRAFKDGRPRKWCGWYMRQRLGVKDPAFNVARRWATYGRPASPGPGVVVVWPHHVGEIVGQNAKGQWLVHSGNDSNRVQTRARSIKGAIAFRI